MSPFSIFFKIAILFAVGIMALSPRDAIHADDLEHYNEFMGSLSDSQFLDMYLENHQVKIDVYEHPSNHLTRSVHFKPSPNADKYFRQEKEQANQILGEPEHSGVEARDRCKRDEYVGRSEAPNLFEKRVSRCYQFCGTIRNCRGNNGCPHCYAVRMGCLWQKWCR